MNKEYKSDIKSKSKSYMLIVSEYFGTHTHKYMLRSELQGDGKITLFLMGIPDLIRVYINMVDDAPDDVRKKLFQISKNAIADYISNNEWVEGGTYYGEYEGDSFKIFSIKPTWADNQWGQKI